MLCSASRSSSTSCATWSLRSPTAKPACRIQYLMSVTTVHSPAEFETRLQSYLFERSEEGRAVRVGEKEISEQAAIVARYASLFSREQVDALRDQEDSVDSDVEGERLYRLRKTCE